MTPPLLGILCGMEAEAAALGRWGEDPRIAIAVTAGRCEGAVAGVARLAAAGPRALLSWGIAGGLDPALGSGTLLVADGVIAPGGRPFAFDRALVAACRAALAVPDAAGPRADAGDLSGTRLFAGVTAVQRMPAAKAALRRRTGAAAVDMESHALAASARDAGIACAAVRAVSDPAGRRLPALVTEALDAAGRPRIGHVLRGLARRPWDLPATLAAGRDSRAALDALAVAADTVIPALLAAVEAGQGGAVEIGPAEPGPAG